MKLAHRHGTAWHGMLAERIDYGMWHGVHTFTPADADTLRDGKGQGACKISTRAMQHASDHVAYPVCRLRAPKRPVNYARACFETAPLLTLLGQVKTVFEKACPIDPRRTIDPD